MEESQTRVLVCCLARTGLFHFFLSYDNGSVIGNFRAYLQMQPNDGQ